MGNRTTTKETHKETPTLDLEEAWDSADGPAVRQVTAVVVGCGERGQNYAAFALDFPSRLKIVGLAEPVSQRRRE